MLESEYEFFLSVETLRFSSMPKLKNLLNHEAKIIIGVTWHYLTKIYSFKKDRMSFSVEILE